MKNSFFNKSAAGIAFLGVLCFLLSACLKESQFDPSQILHNDNLYIEPNVVLAGEPFGLRASTKVDSSLVIENNVLWLKRIPNDGSAAILVFQLYDNGDYNNNDYQAGDFWYNGMINYGLLENEADTVKYIATGQVLQPDGTYQEEELGYAYMKIYGN